MSTLILNFCIKFYALNGFLAIFIKVFVNQRLSIKFRLKKTNENSSTIIRYVIKLFDKKSFKEF